MSANAHKLESMCRLSSVVRSAGKGKWGVAIMLAAVVATLLVGSEVGILSRWVVAVVVVVLGVLSACEVAGLSMGPKPLSPAPQVIALLTALAGAAIYTALWLDTSQHWKFYVVLVGIICSDAGAQLVGASWCGAATKKPASRFLQLGARSPTTFRKISPSKSMSGYVGGIAVGAVGVLAVLTLAGQSATWWPALVVPIAAEVGDLLASKLKRLAGVKDFMLPTIFVSSMRLPNPLLGSHGGIADRGDGHFFVAATVGLLLYVL